MAGRRLHGHGTIAGYLLGALYGIGLILAADPLLVALGNARAAREAADREIRHLLAYGREFHGDRPYKLEPLAQTSGMTPSGIRTAYGSSEIETVARGIGRTPDSRRTRPPATPQSA
ncbi:hypothetical protein PV726_48480 [Streptomyces europaeiscabiei]|uniref:hypothetical protein n=1 Tax=Streptomyces europaeiscabiei TaxID=146819 RepID=UPI0029AB896E|nr:hypothetical protein [Streptomyces europaeiscabiei]MDX3697866.1 hypothetical protein [Streptomyces europaeiscabiei]